MNGLPSIAQHLAAQGRNGDSMLMHVTPGEVRGLQAIAEQHGTSLTINPDTGLPEAFSLRSLLPMIAGIALTPVLGPMGAALAVGGGTTVATGDIKQGLMAGLGAYGGASLGAGLGAAGQVAAGQSAAITPSISNALTSAPATAAAPSYALTSGAGTASSMGLGGGLTIPQVTTLTPTAAAPGLGIPASIAAPVSQVAGAITPAAAPVTFGNMGRGFTNILSSGPSGDAARSAFMSNIGGAKGLAMRGGAAILPGLMERPDFKLPDAEDPYANYEGPYTPSPREVRYPTEDDLRRRRTSEFTYFSPSNPVPFQEGGNVISSINVTPAEADVYRNIANVQRMAGIPSIANMPMMVHPQRDMRELVYNPIEYVPSSIPMGERNYGFAPLMSREDAETKFENIKRRMPNDGTSILREEEPASASYDYFGFKRGGVPTLEDGGFVLTKKAVDGLGKGDNKRGQKVASAGLGAIPIKGPGHGTSDSIRTSIEGKQPALVSNGEAYVPRRSVQKNGGAKKFYALMRAAERRA